MTKLGIVAVKVDADIAKLIPGQRKPGGLLVMALTAGSIGRVIGLKPGDIIYELNNKSVDSMELFRKELAILSPKARAILQIERDGILCDVIFSNPE